MTWVVAHANPGAVLMVGDVRVSVNGEELRQFGVRKTHHVAPTVFAGFAGSVVLGFRLVADVRAYLHETFDQNVSTITLAEGWASDLPQRIAAIVPRDLASQRTDLLIAGMHLAPVKNADGTPTGKRTTYGSGCRCVLSEPGNGSVEVERFAWKSAGVSVGLGSKVPEYQSLLTDLDWVQLSNWRDAAGAVGALMRMTVESRPTSGIGTDLTAMMMKSAGKAGVSISAHTSFPPATRALIAENEAQLDRLRSRFKLQGANVSVLAGGASTVRGIRRTPRYRLSDGEADR